MAKKNKKKTSTINNFFQIFFNRDLLSNVLNIASYHEDGFFYLESENTLVTVYEFNLLAGISENSIINLTAMLNSSMPPDALIQIMQFSSPLIEPVLHDFEVKRMSQHSSISNTIEAANILFNDRLNMMRKGVREKLLITNNTVVNVRKGIWIFKVKLKTQSPFSHLTADMRAFDEEQAAFLDNKNRIVEQFKAGGIVSTALNEKETLALLREYLNPYEPKDNSYDSHKLIKNQIQPVGSIISWSRFDSQLIEIKGVSSTNETLYAGVISFDRFPDENVQYNIYQVLKLLGSINGRGTQIGMPFAIVSNMFFPDQNKKKEKYRTKEIRVKNTRSTMDKWSTKMRIIRNDIEILSHEIADNNALLEVGMSLVIWNHSPNEIFKTFAALESYYKSLGFTALRERYGSNVAWLNAMPAFPSTQSYDKIYRTKTMSGSMAVHLLPIMAQWEGYGHDLLLNTQQGSVFGFSLFHKNNKNFNFSVCGTAGSGKTFFNQHIIQSYLSMGCKVFLIDTGMSYVGTGALLDAQIIDFNEKSKFCLNPFTEIKFNQFEFHITAILNLLIKMMNDSEPATTDEIAYFEKAINSVWENKGNNANIDDVIEFLRKQNTDNVESELTNKMANKLDRFGRNGIYGKWFNGVNNFKAEADYTILELSNLNHEPHLREVIMVALGNSISKEMLTSNDGRKRMLIIEEAADRLEDENFLRFINFLLRKIRKEHGSLGIVLQSLGQIKENKEGRDLFSNINTRFFLQQNQETINNIIKSGKLSVGDYEEYLIKNVTTYKGAYSEIAVITENVSGIAIYIGSELEQLLASTEDDNFDKIKKIFRSDGLEAVKKYLLIKIIENNRLEAHARNYFERTLKKLESGN